MSGNQILRDGQPFIPHGVMLVAFVAPPAAQHADKPVFPGAYQHYSPAEMTAIKVSQPGADPESPLYDPAFVAKVREAVLAGRAPRASP